MLIVTSGFAQTSQAVNSQSVTFTLRDVLSVMSPEEVEAFQQLRLRMKKVRREQKKLDPGTDSYTFLENGFNQLKEELEEEFADYRGFQGKTVTLHGDPLPDREDVVALITSARKDNGEMPLHPHWFFDEETGLLRGSNSPPTSIEGGAETNVSDAVDLDLSKVQVPARSNVGDGVDAECAQIAGPVDENWYRNHGDPPKCTCTPPEDQVFGVPSCWWYSDGTRPSQ